MKRFGLIVFVMMLFMSAAEAGHGKRETKAVFTARHGQLIKVFVDGHAINKYPQGKVKLKMYPGKKRVKIKVFNRRGRIAFVIQKRIHISQGFTNYFTLGANRYGELSLRKTAQIQFAPYKPVRAHHWDHDRRDRHVVVCRTH